MKLLGIAAITAVLLFSPPAGNGSRSPEDNGRSAPVVVTDVYDGDTIVVGSPPDQTVIRLIGVDTPEVARPEHPVEFYGPQASEFTRRSLLGKRVTVEREAADRPGGQIDKYGRLLAYVITEDGRNFNLELVRLGYGRVFTKYPFRVQRQFKEAERKARAKGLGMWSEQERVTWSDPAARGRIIGNIKSHIYHLPGNYGYNKVAEKNRIYFRTEDEAREAGYRKAKY